MSEDLVNISEIRGKHNGSDFFQYKIRLQT